MADLHAGFVATEGGISADLEEFLDQADRMPAVQAVRRDMAAALDPRPGERVLDFGCGIGTEVTRLARAYPQTEFVGVDHSADLLAVAARRATDTPNLTWLRGELPGAPGTFNAIRAERVLMYLPDPAYGQALDLLANLLRPGGRVVLFELDYGSLILPPGSHPDDLAASLSEILRRSLPQPWAGRKIPRHLAERGLTPMTAHPYVLELGEPVWRRIIRDPLTAHRATAPAALDAWLTEQTDPVNPFRGAVTGILTTAVHRPFQQW